MYGVSMKMMLALTAFVVLGEAQNPPPNILIGAPAHQVQGGDLPTFDCKIAANQHVVWNLWDKKLLVKCNGTHSLTTVAENIGKDQCSFTDNALGQDFSIITLSANLDQKNRSEWSFCDNPADTKSQRRWIICQLNDQCVTLNALVKKFGTHQKVKACNIVGPASVSCQSKSNCNQAMNDIELHLVGNELTSLFNTCDFGRLYEDRLTSSIPCHIVGNQAGLVFGVPARQNSLFYCKENVPVLLTNNVCQHDNVCMTKNAILRALDARITDFPRYTSCGDLFRLLRNYSSVATFAPYAECDFNRILDTDNRNCSIPEHGFQYPKFRLNRYSDGDNRVAEWSACSEGHYFVVCQFEGKCLPLVELMKHTNERQRYSNRCDQVVQYIPDQELRQHFGTRSCGFGDLYKYSQRHVICRIPENRGFIFLDDIEDMSQQYHCDSNGYPEHTTIDADIELCEFDGRRIFRLVSQTNAVGDWAACSPAKDWTFEVSQEALSSCYYLAQNIADEKINNDIGNGSCDFSRLYREMELAARAPCMARLNRQNWDFIVDYHVLPYYCDDLGYPTVAKTSDGRRLALITWNDDSIKAKGWRTSRRLSDVNTHPHDVEICQINDRCVLKDVARSYLKTIEKHYNPEETCQTIFALSNRKDNFRNWIFDQKNDCNFDRMISQALYPTITPYKTYPSCTAKSHHRNFAFFDSINASTPAACDKTFGMRARKITVPYVAGGCRYNIEKIYAVVNTAFKDDMSEWKFCSANSNEFDVTACVVDVHCVRLSELRYKTRSSGFATCFDILQNTRVRSQFLSDSTKCDFEALAKGTELIKGGVATKPPSHRGNTHVNGKPNPVCKFGNEQFYFRQNGMLGYCSSHQWIPNAKRTHGLAACFYDGRTVIEIVKGDNMNVQGLAIYKFCSTKQPTIEVCRVNETCVSTKEILNKIYELTKANAKMYQGCVELMNYWQKKRGIVEYSKFFVSKPNNHCDFNRFLKSG